MVADNLVAFGDHSIPQFDRILLGRIDDDVRAHLRGELASFGGGLRRDDDLRSARFRGDDGAQSDRSATDDERRIGRGEAGLLEMHLADVERFGKCGVLE